MPQVALDGWKPLPCITPLQGEPVPRPTYRADLPTVRILWHPQTTLMQGAIFSVGKNGTSLNYRIDSVLCSGQLANKYLYIL